MRTKQFIHIFLWSILPMFVHINLQAQTENASDMYCEPKTLFELFKKKDSVLVVKPEKIVFFLSFRLLDPSLQQDLYWAELPNILSKERNLRINIR